MTALRPVYQASIGRGSRRAVTFSIWTRLGRSLALPGSRSLDLGASPGGLSKRSNEMLYRSWATMEQFAQGRALIVGFQSEFRQMLDERGHPGHRIAQALVKSFVRCPPDPAEDRQPFWMGSPEGEPGRCEDEARHEVVVDPFRMGKHTVTNEQYELFDPSHAEHRGFGGRLTPRQLQRCPVVKVSWYDAWAFCRWLGPAYRLPTETEWEYACRAGATTAYCFGDDAAELPQYAWFWENSGHTVHPVGEKRANAWGLHDLHGNVWEWCADWFGQYDRSDCPLQNPTGCSAGTCRVMRGGSWDIDREFARCAYLFGHRPDYRFGNLGFRVVASPSGSDSGL